MNICVVAVNAKNVEESYVKIAGSLSALFVKIVGRRCYELVRLEFVQVNY